MGFVQFTSCNTFNSMIPYASVMQNWRQEDQSRKAINYSIDNINNTYYIKYSGICTVHFMQYPYFYDSLCISHTKWGAGRLRQKSHKLQHRQYSGLQSTHQEAPLYPTYTMIPPHNASCKNHPT